MCISVDDRSKSVYKSCGQMYIGERQGTRLKEHKDACVKYEPAIADHAWTHHCPINWEKTHNPTVLHHFKSLCFPDGGWCYSRNVVVYVFVC